MFVSKSEKIWKASQNKTGIQNKAVTAFLYAVNQIDRQFPFELSVQSEQVVLRIPPCLGLKTSEQVVEALENLVPNASFVAEKVGNRFSVLGIL